MADHGFQSPDKGFSETPQILILPSDIVSTRPANSLSSTSCGLPGPMFVRICRLKFFALAMPDRVSATAPETIASFVAFRAGSFFVVIERQRPMRSGRPRGRRRLHEAQAGAQTTKYSPKWAAEHAHATPLPDNQLALAFRIVCTFISSVVLRLSRRGAEVRWTDRAFEPCALALRISPGLPDPGTRREYTGLPISVRRELPT